MPNFTLSNSLHIPEEFPLQQHHRREAKTLRILRSPRPFRTAYMQSVISTETHSCAHLIHWHVIYCPKWQAYWFCTVLSVNITSYFQFYLSVCPSSYTYGWRIFLGDFPEVYFSIRRKLSYQMQHTNLVQ